MSKSTLLCLVFAYYSIRKRTMSPQRKEGRRKRLVTSLLDGCRKWKNKVLLIIMFSNSKKKCIFAKCKFCF